MGSIVRLSRLIIANGVSPSCPSRPSCASSCPSCPSHESYPSFSSCPSCGSSPSSPSSPSCPSCLSCSSCPSSHLSRPAPQVHPPLRLLSYIQYNLECNYFLELLLGYYCRIS